MNRKERKTWDMYFLIVILFVLLIEFGIGDIENFYFVFNMYDKNDLIRVELEN